MIFAFPTVRKVQSDVISVTLDWTNLLPTLAEEGVSVSAHTVEVFESGLVATDATEMENAVQTVTLSGGAIFDRAIVVGKVTLSDGTIKSRAMLVIVE